MENIEKIRPKLAKNTNIKIEDSNIIIENSYGDFKLDISEFIDEFNGKNIVNIIKYLDGMKSVSEILFELKNDSDKKALIETIKALDESCFIDDITETHFKSGLECLLELEDLTNSLLNETIYKNPFWLNMSTMGKNYPKSVLYGFAIENYHFLFRESSFDSPVLFYQNSTKIRELFNEFYVEEIGHDKLILKSLETIGFTKEKLFDRTPLASTMLMCNALSHWATTDPIFFFSTLSLLEGSTYREDSQIDSYIDICEMVNLPNEFIKHIKSHAMINLSANHGSLTRSIFNEIKCISNAKLLDMKNKTKLFIDIYNSFYQEVWDYYSNKLELKREVSEINI